MARIPAFTLVATKVVSVAPVTTAVQLVAYGATGNILFALTVAAADFTSINTTVNGGSVGATLSFSYPQSAYPGTGGAVNSQGDYPLGYIPKDV